MKRRTKKRPYKSLQDWMERTGSTQTKLAERSGIAQPILSKILTGGRMCSLENALKLSEATGVPVEKIANWKRRVARPAISEQPFKSDLPRSA